MVQPTNLAKVPFMNKYYRLGQIARVTAIACLALMTSPLLGQHRARPERVVLFSDNFDGRETIGDDYVLKGDMGKGWSLVDGVLVCAQFKEDHGSVIRRNHDFADIDLEIDFRFNGGKSFNFVLDDQNEKSVHAGHICRVSIFPKNLIVQDDKTGVMNQTIRKKRKSKNLSSAEKKQLEKLLVTKKASGKLALKKGQWYRLRIQIAGDRLTASIDDEEIASLQSPGIAHPTKTKFGMTVNGKTIEFDNLVVYEN